MNKVNWVDGRYTTPGDFNAMQSAPEDHLRTQAKSSLAGLVDGMLLTGTSNGVQVGPGVAWDNQGRRIMVPAAAPVDVSAIQRPASGRHKWVSVFASYRQVERATVTDATGVDQPAYLDDGYTLTAAAGPEFIVPTSPGRTANDLLKELSLFDPEGGESNYPPTPPGAVRVAVFPLDPDTAWADLVFDRQQFGSPSHRIAVISSSTTPNVDAAICRIVSYPDIAYAWGAVSAPAPANLTSAPVVWVECRGRRELPQANIVAVKNGARFSLLATAPGLTCLIVVVRPL